MAISNEDKLKVFNQFRAQMGAPIRNIEIEDETLCILLEIAIEDYAQYIQEWLIEHQWQSLLGANIDTTDMAFAMSVRSLDFISQYSYAYSKQVGLQTRGPWELKKDYVELEAGRQVYQIPAGREINEVLWMTPPVTDMALMANYAGIDYGFGGGMGQLGNAGGGGAGGAGTGGYYIAPAYDILLTAQDFNLKNRILRSEMTYKVTAGPNGTRLLHLMSVPGSKLSFGHGFGGAGASSINITGCQVWYHYYDTTPENINECRLDNPDIIKLPNEVPLSKLDYSDFNEPTKTLVRQLFVAESKRALGRTRGKFGGIVGPPEAERTMDYETLISEGNDERRFVLERLDERLLRLSSTSQIERAANEAENLNRQLKFKPLGFYFK
tara:strand:+ start:4699 stop:5844 length:1146 start_codon:yes stop_codon:yes gene_type:complete